MKKFSVILLIAVLAIGCVFAETAEATTGITGEATVAYAFDFDEHTLGYAKTDSTVYASLDVAGATKISEGTGLWGEISAELKFSVKPSKRDYAIHTTDKVALAVTPSLALKTLKIHNGDVWTLDLLSAKAIGDFAKSAIDYAYNVSKQEEALLPTKTASYYDNTVALKKNAKGFTFDWNDFSFVAAANFDWNKEDDAVVYANSGRHIDAYAGVQTPEFAFGAFTLQGAGGFAYALNDLADATEANSEYGWYATTVNAKTGLYDEYVPGPEGTAKVAGKTTTDNGTITDITILHDEARVTTKKLDATTDKEVKTVVYVPVAYKKVVKDHAGVKTTSAWTLAASLKFGVTTDVFKTTVATDQTLCIDAIAKTHTYNTDVALNAVFGEKFATLDAYFANAAAYLDGDGNPAGEKPNLLSAKVAFDLNEFGAPLTVSVSALDIIKAANLSVEAELTLAEKHTLGVYANDLLAKAAKREVGVNSSLVFEPVTIDLSLFAGIPGDAATRTTAEYKVTEKYVGYTIDAEYENQYFTAALSVENDFSYEDPANADLLIGASIEAEGTVIENATLSLDYTSGNLLTKEFGAVTAACTIAF